MTEAHSSSNSLSINARLRLRAEQLDDADPNLSATESTPDAALMDSAADEIERLTRDLEDARFIAREQENAHVAANLRAAEANTSAQGWRCFHCDEVFTDRAAARDHFGRETTDETNCVASERRWRDECRRLRAELERAAEDRVTGADAQENARLRAAGIALYMAGRWTLPRSEMHQSDMAKLWEDLRDALGLAPGTATAAGLGAAAESAETVPNADKVAFSRPEDRKCECWLPFDVTPGPHHSLKCPQYRPAAETSAVQCICRYGEGPQEDCPVHGRPADNSVAGHD